MRFIGWVSLFQQKNHKHILVSKHLSPDPAKLNFQRKVEKRLKNKKNRILSGSGESRRKIC